MDFTRALDVLFHLSVPYNGYRAREFHYKVLSSWTSGLRPCPRSVPVSPRTSTPISSRRTRPSAVPVRKVGIFRNRWSPGHVCSRRRQLSLLRRRPRLTRSVRVQFPPLGSRDFDHFEVPSANVHLVRFGIGRHMPDFCRQRIAPEPLMVQSFRSSPPFLRVQKQKLIDQVHAFGVRVIVVPHFLSQHAWAVRLREIDALRLQAFDFREQLPSGVAIVRQASTQLKHFRVLVEFRVPSHHRSMRIKLGDHAADAPDVHGGSVFRGTEEEFGRTVPARHDLVGIFAVWVLDVQGASETKVGDFEEAGVRDKDVGGFNVPVNDVVLSERPKSATSQGLLTRNKTHPVKIVHALEKLLCPHLVNRQSKIAWLVSFEKTGKVVREEIERHVNLVPLSNSSRVCY